jgi:hypothetical protein
MLVGIEMIVDDENGKFFTNREAAIAPIPQHKKIRAAPIHPTSHQILLL